MTSHSPPTTAGYVAAPRLGTETRSMVTEAGGKDVWNRFSAGQHAKMEILIE
jgi:hypothetical protein